MRRTVLLGRARRKRQCTYGTGAEEQVTTGPASTHPGGAGQIHAAGAEDRGGARETYCAWNGPIVSSSMEALLQASEGWATKRDAVSSGG